MGRSKASVELFEAIRREYEFGIGTIQGVARTFNVHRRLVREALASAVPAPRKRPVRDRPRIGPLVAFIDAILTADQRAPRKQRHTAHRIYTRIQTERPDCPITEGAVRKIAEEAARSSRIGARALKAVWGKIIKPYEFDPFSQPDVRQEGGTHRLRVDEAFVSRALKPAL